MCKSKIERVEFYSQSLAKQMAICVYLPANYSTKVALPVLYFLHGRSGDENFMSSIGMDVMADKLINSGDINPFIIVCPKMENSRGINSSEICSEVLDSAGRTMNIGRYEDYFINEVVPLVDNTFSTVNNASNRFVGGVSAGGYAALHYAFRHPNMFSKVGGHMPAIELSLDDEDKPYFSESGTWEKYNPLEIAALLPSHASLQVYLDAGDCDEGEFYKGCSALHSILQSKEIKSENHLFSGHHNAEYVMSNLDKYLKFYNSRK